MGKEEFDCIYHQFQTPLSLHYSQFYTSRLLQTVIISHSTPGLIPLPVFKSIPTCPEPSSPHSGYTLRMRTKQHCRRQQARVAANDARVMMLGAEIMSLQLGITP